MAIIDEASQSGPEALLLAYLAKKLVVVGDDKQISPSNIGIVGEDAVRLVKPSHPSQILSQVPGAAAAGCASS